MPTPLLPETLQAYRETEYHIHCTPAFVLRVDQYAPPLFDLHGQWGVASSAWITADNPYSQILADTVNRQRQARLARHLEMAAFPKYPATGQHPHNGWPSEHGYLVLGITKDMARRMGKIFDQHAILWMDQSATPQILRIA